MRPSGHAAIRPCGHPAIRPWPLLKKITVRAMAVGLPGVTQRPSGHMAAFEKIYCTFKKAAMAGHCGQWPAMAPPWPDGHLSHAMRPIHPWPPMAAHGHPWPPMAAFSQNYFIRGRMVAFFGHFIKKRLWPHGRPSVFGSEPDGKVRLTEKLTEPNLARALEN